MASGVFIVLGVSTLSDSPVLGWVGVAIGIPGAMTSLLVLVSGAHLELTEEGYVEHMMLGREIRVGWDEVQEFVAPSGLGATVGVIFDSDHVGAESKLIRRLVGTSGKVFGYHGALMDSYGLKTKELAALRNSRLAEHGSRRDRD